MRVEKVWGSNTLIFLNRKCRTIKDTCEEIGLMLDLENPTTREMYGIGGTVICIGIGYRQLPDGASPWIY